MTDLGERIINERLAIVWFFEQLNNGIVLYGDYKLYRYIYCFNYDHQLIITVGCRDTSRDTEWTPITSTEELFAAARDAYEDERNSPPVASTEATSVSDDIRQIEL